MPQTTRGYPYPDGSAKVGEFDLHVKALADAIEARLGRIDSGAVTITIEAVDTVYGADVVFAPPFQAPPHVAFAKQTGSPNQVDVSITNLTAAGFTIRASRSTGLFAVPVTWIARG